MGLMVAGPATYSLASVMASVAQSSAGPRYQMTVVALVMLTAFLGLVAFAARKWGDGHAEPGPDPFTRRQLVALWSLLTLSAVLRLWGSNSDLWYDEIITLVEFVRLPAWDLVTSYTTPNNHILYSLAAHFSIELFGEAPWSLRLPAILFGTASIWALVYLARQVASNTMALWAGLLLALSYHHVWFSQNARGYTGLLFWTLLGTAVFYRGLRQTGARPWLWYGAILGLALYTHLTAVFVFMAHGVVYLFLLASRRLRPAADDPLPGANTLWPLVGFTLGLLLAFQAYSLILPQMFQAFGEQAGAAASQVKVTEWRNPLWTVVEMAQGMRLGFASFAGMALVVVLAALGTVSLWRSNPVMLWLMWLNVPMTLAVLLLVQFHIWPRYFFVNIGFGVLLLTEGAWWIARRLESIRGPAGRATGPLVAGLLAVVTAVTLVGNYRYPKQAYSTTRDYVERNRSEEEPVVSAGLVAKPFADYYAPEWDTVATVAGLIEIEQRGGRPWVVYSFPSYMATAHRELLDHLALEYDSVAAFPGTLSGGVLLVFHKDNGD